MYTEPWYKTMISVSDYSLMHNEGDDFFVKSNGNPPPCPKCRGQLEYRDRKRRIMRLEGAEKQWILIRRFRCTGCCRYHNELPDCLVPFKHYKTEIIAGVLDGIVTPEDLDSEDYPCMDTMLLWLCWFQLNQERIEGYLRTIAYELSDGKLSVLHSDLSLLKWFRLHARNWLERIIHSIYNSGGFLVSFRF